MSRRTISIKITITDHAYDRAKERLHIDKKGFERLALKAFIAGKKHAQCKGRLKKYIDGIYLQYRQANNVRLYGEILYLFRENTLITLYQIPNELKPLARL